MATLFCRRLQTRPECDIGIARALSAHVRTSSLAHGSCLVQRSRQQLQWHHSPSSLVRPRVTNGSDSTTAGCPAVGTTTLSRYALSNTRRYAKTAGLRSEGDKKDEHGISTNTKDADPIQKQDSTVTRRVRSSVANLTPHENIYNLPNFLTVTRLIAAPTTAYLLMHDQHKWALALFAYAGITDLVDGWLARRWKLQTVAGSVIDPMADKALMIIVTVTLAVKGLLPVYLATLILGRDASLAIAAIYYRYASLPSPKTMARYWDFSLPSAEVHPTTVSKYNTFLQLLVIGSALALPVITADNPHLGVMHDLGLDSFDLHQAITGLQILVAATTVWSGLSYAFLKDAVTIMGKDEALKARQGARGRAIIGVTFGAVVIVAAYMALDSQRQRQARNARSKQEQVSG